MNITLFYMILLLLTLFLHNTTSTAVKLPLEICLLISQQLDFKTLRSLDCVSKGFWPDNNVAPFKKYNSILCNYTQDTTYYHSFEQKLERHLKSNRLTKEEHQENMDEYSLKKNNALLDLQQKDTIVLKPVKNTGCAHSLFFEFCATMKNLKHLVIDISPNQYNWKTFAPLYEKENINTLTLKSLPHDQFCKIDFSQFLHLKILNIGSPDATETISKESKYYIDTVTKLFFPVIDTINRLSLESFTHQSSNFSDSCLLYFLKNKKISKALEKDVINNFLPNRYRVNDYIINESKFFPDFFCGILSKKKKKKLAVAVVDRINFDPLSAILVNDDNQLPVNIYFYGTSFHDFLDVISTQGDKASEMLKHVKKIIIAANPYCKGSFTIRKSDFDYFPDNMTLNIKQRETPGNTINIDCSESYGKKIKQLYFDHPKYYCLNNSLGIKHITTVLEDGTYDLIKINGLSYYLEAFLDKNSVVFFLESRFVYGTGLKTYEKENPKYSEIFQKIFGYSSEWHLSDQMQQREYLEEKIKKFIRDCFWSFEQDFEKNKALSVLKRICETSSDALDEVQKNCLDKDFLKHWDFNRQIMREIIENILPKNNVKAIINTIKEIFTPSEEPDTFSNNQITETHKNDFFFHYFLLPTLGMFTGIVIGTFITYYYLIHILKYSAPAQKDSVEASTSTNL